MKNNLKIHLVSLGLFLLVLNGCDNGFRAGLLQENFSSGQEVINPDESGDEAGGDPVGGAPSPTPNPNPTPPPPSPPLPPVVGGPPAGSYSANKLSCQEAQFVIYLNIYRAQNSLNALKPSLSGSLAARWHSQNMIDLNYFDHYEPNGRNPFDRMNSFGYPGHAENAAYGNQLATRTFCQWRTSVGHNGNMLGKNHVSTGIGKAQLYWSSNFGPATKDSIAEPYTDDPGCVLNSTLPAC